SARAYRRGRDRSSSERSWSVLHGGWLLGGIGDGEQVLRDVEHAVGEAPFVVEPGQQVNQARAGDPGLAAVDDGRMGIMVEIATGVRQLGIGQQPLERAGLG